MVGLLNDIRAGRYGSYYAIWDVIGRRASAIEAGWLLFEVLNRPIDYLHRYHCAEALLKVLRCEVFEPVHLSAESLGMRENLAALESILRERIGPRPSDDDEVVNK